jgi:hypothetical protein
MSELKDSGQRSVYNTGAQRDNQEGKGRFDLIPFQGLMRLAKHYEAGAKKYSTTFNLYPEEILVKISEEIEKCKSVLNVKIKFIAKECAEVITKKVSEKEIRNMLIDKGNNQTNGGRNIQNGLKIQPKKEGKTLIVDKEIKKLRKLGFLEKEDSLKKQVYYYFKNKIIAVESVEEISTMLEPYILTMIITQKKQEDIYVVDATTVLGCLKSLLKLSKKLFYTSEIIRLENSQDDEKIEITYTGDRNWEKGMNISRYADAAMRHLLKYMAGWNDEDHLAAVAWNVFSIMHHEKYFPELQDFPEWKDRVSGFIVKEDLGT